MSVVQKFELEITKNTLVYTTHVNYKKKTVIHKQVKYIIGVLLKVSK